MSDIRLRLKLIFKASKEQHLAETQDLNCCCGCCSSWLKSLSLCLPTQWSFVVVLVIVVVVKVVITANVFIEVVAVDIVINVVVVVAVDLAFVVIIGADFLCMDNWKSVT